MLNTMTPPQRHLQPQPTVAIGASSPLVINQQQQESSSSSTITPSNGASSPSSSSSSASSSSSLSSTSSSMSTTSKQEAKITQVPQQRTTLKEECDEDKASECHNELVNNQPEGSTRQDGVDDKAATQDELIVSSQNQTNQTHLNDTEDNASQNNSSKHGQKSITNTATATATAIEMKSTAPFEQAVRTTASTTSSSDHGNSQMRNSSNISNNNYHSSAYKFNSHHQHHSQQHQQSHHQNNTHSDTTNSSIFQATRSISQRSHNSNSHHHNRHYKNNHQQPPNHHHHHTQQIHNHNQQNQQSSFAGSSVNSDNCSGQHVPLPYNSSSSSADSLAGSDFASRNSSHVNRRTATSNSNGPPHYVDLHVNAGECVSLQLLDGQEQVVAGPATITMVSQQQSPPVPIPVQVPPGHTINQIADENGTLKHIILSVMNCEDNQHIDTNVINFPHGSFRVDALGELVSTSTSLVAVDGDSSGEISQQHNQNLNLAAPPQNADMKSVLSNKTTDPNAHQTQKHQQNFISNYQANSVPGDYVDGVQDPCRSNALGNQGAASDNFSLAANVHNENATLFQASGDKYKHSQGTYDNENDKKAIYLSSSRDKGDISTDMTNYDPKREYIPSHSTMKHQQPEIEGDSTNDGATCHEQPFTLTDGSSVNLQPSMISGGYDPAPSDSDPSMMAASRQMLPPVDGQIYGYPTCCCCCYCDPNEAAASGQPLQTTQQAIPTGAMLGQQDVIMMPQMHPQPPALHDTTAGTITGQQHPLMSSHAGGSDSANSMSANCVNMPLAYHQGSMISNSATSASLNASSMSQHTNAVTTCPQQSFANHPQTTLGDSSSGLHHQSDGPTSVINSKINPGKGPRGLHSYKQHGSKGHTNQHNHERHHGNYTGNHHYNHQNAYNNGLSGAGQSYHHASGSSPSMYNSSQVNHNVLMSSSQVPASIVQPYQPTYSSYNSQTHSSNKNASTVSSGMGKMSLQQQSTGQSRKSHEPDSGSYRSSKNDHPLNDLLCANESQPGKRHYLANVKSTGSRYNVNLRVPNNNHMIGGHGPSSADNYSVGGNHSTSSGSVSPLRSIRGNKAHHHHQTGHNYNLHHQQSQPPNGLHSHMNYILGQDPNKYIAQPSWGNKQNSSSKNLFVKSLPDHQGGQSSIKQQPIVSNNQDTKSANYVSNRNVSHVKSQPEAPRGPFTVPARHQPSSTQSSGSTHSNKNDGANSACGRVTPSANIATASRQANKLNSKSSNSCETLDNQQQHLQQQSKKCTESSKRGQDSNSAIVQETSRNSRGKQKRSQKEDNARMKQVQNRSPSSVTRKNKPIDKSDGNRCLSVENSESKRGRLNDAQEQPDRKNLEVQDKENTPRLSPDVKPSARSDKKIDSDSVHLDASGDSFDNAEPDQSKAGRISKETSPKSCVKSPPSNKSQDDSTNKIDARLTNEIDSPADTGQLKKDKQQRQASPKKSPPSTQPEQPMKTESRKKSPKSSDPSTAVKPVQSESNDQDESTHVHDISLGDEILVIESVSNGEDRQNKPTFSITMRSSHSSGDIKSLDAMTINAAKSTQTTPQKEAVSNMVVPELADKKSLSTGRSSSYSVVAESSNHQDAKKKLETRKKTASASNKSEQIRLNSLPQIRMLSLNCASITSNSVCLRWSYIPALAEKYGITNHHHHGHKNASVLDHFVVELSGNKNIEANTLNSSKVVFQGCSMTCRVNQLNPDKIYHFRVRRTALVSVGNTEHLAVSEILSVTLPNVQQQINTNTMNSTNANATNSTKHKSATSGESSSNNVTTTLSSSNNTSRGNTTSSHQASSQNIRHQHKHHHQQPFKVMNNLKQCRNKLVTNIGKLVQTKLSNYSDTKFAGLLLVIFTMFATLLAIFIDYYIVAPVTEL